MIYSFPAKQDRPQTLRATSEQYCQTEEIWRSSSTCQPRCTAHAALKLVESGPFWMKLLRTSHKSKCHDSGPPLDLESPFQYSNVLPRNRDLSTNSCTGSRRRSAFSLRGLRRDTTTVCLDVPNSLTRCSLSTTYNEHLQPHRMLPSNDLDQNMHSYEVRILCLKPNLKQKAAH